MIQFRPSDFKRTAEIRSGVGEGVRRPKLGEVTAAPWPVLADLAPWPVMAGACWLDEVGDGSDSWAPPVGVPRAQDTPVSGGSEVERHGCWAAQRGPGAGPRREEERRGEKESRPRGVGERRLGGAQEQRGRESFSFYFLFLFLKQTYFKIFSKPNLNSFSIFIQTTHHNKSNTRACMLKQVVNSYSKF